MSRLIIVANRLPITITEKKGKFKAVPSAGGLATGLQGLSRHFELIWVGWPGLNVSGRNRQAEVKKILADHSMHPVFIESGRFNNYYGGFSNSTLWPLFHYFQQFADFHSRTWKDYKAVNRQFADAVGRVARKDDTFWVHDYHLMLLPRLLRDKYPRARIGFFLHIPFPSYELVRTLPWRESLLSGVLGADLVGFHTFDYVRHFTSAISRILHLEEHYLGRIRFGNRVVDIDSFPLGIDYQRFARAVQSDDTRQEIERYRQQIGDVKIILNIDRLDYTKALPQRLKAFELLLNKYPQYRGQVSMLVILVPSRDNVGRYKQLKEEIDRTVGYINSRYGRFGWTPVHYYYRSIRFSRLTAWYKLAPVALITPYRDGMNLVSKEYLACKDDGRGVLILSEMAGSAKELVEALSVNPNNTEDIARALHQALQMPPEEQESRIRKMQQQLRRNDAAYWARHFLERLGEAYQASAEVSRHLFDKKVANRLIRQYQRADQRLIFLDYDGTLANFRGDPQAAAPTRPLHTTLARLAGNPKNTVVMISGRDKHTLEKWFGNLPLHLVAEHGAWHKMAGAKWQKAAAIDTSWKKEMLPIFIRFADRTPGSFYEEKNYSLAWHYRKTDPGLAEMRKHEFMDKLSTAIYGRPLQIMEGNKVLEVKNVEINKGKAARLWLEQQDWPFVLAIGDDYTDEDTFKAMPPHACTLKVGFTDTHARYNIGSVEEVLDLLDRLNGS